MSLKTIFAIISLLFGTAIFIPYYIGLIQKKTKPHLFSWLTWSLLIGLGFVLSYKGGGGAGSLPFLVDGLLCFTIAVYALVKGEKNITRLDWIAFISALIIMIFYVLTKNAVVSVILTATIDFLGYVPTYRKSYLQPYQEPALTYFFALVSWVFSLGALGTYTFVTMFYPLSLIATNGAFILFLLMRRKVIMAK